MFVVRDDSAPQEIKPDTTYKVKTFETTYPDIRIAIAQVFDTLNIKDDEQKEVFVPFVFELFLKLGMNHYDIVKLLSNNV